MKVKKAIRTPEQVLEILSDTPLGFLVESLRYGLDRHFDFKTDSVAEGETVIGEMTEVERIIHAATMNARRHAIEIAKANNAMVDEAVDEDDPAFQHQVLLNKGQYKAFDTLADAFNVWCWYSLQKRIGVPSTEAPGIGIREGCVVVARSHEAVAGSLVEKQMRELFESILCNQEE